MADNTETTQPKFPKYSGYDKELRVQTWLALFEVHTDDKSEAERTKLLMYSLDKSALEWYGDVVVGNNLSWLTVKELMIARFGTSTATPLIDAQRRRLQKNETVEQYFGEKIRLLRQAGLDEPSMVDQLTEGLPFSWKLTLTAASPTNTTAWIQVAQRTETHFKSRQTSDIPTGNANPSRVETRTLVSDTRQRTFRQGNSNRSPPPCRYCQRLNIDINHWHRECPNNPFNNASQSADDPPVQTLSSMESDSNEESEN